MEDDLPPPPPEFFPDEIRIDESAADPSSAYEQPYSATKKKPGNRQSVLRRGQKFFMESSKNE